MRDPKTFSGRVIEIRRFVVPLNPFKSPANRERWDLWLAASEGQERQFIAVSPTMPARRGHQVVLAILRGVPVGIVNQTTGACLNFVQADPPAVYHPMDGLVPVLLFIVSVIIAMVVDSPAIFLLSVPLAVLYVPAVMIGRALRNAATRAMAERVLDRIGS